MLGTQIRAFATAFAELWQRQQAAEDLVEDCKLRWWNYVFGVLAWLAFAVSVHLIVRGAEPVAGWLLLMWPHAWLGLRLARLYKARVAVEQVIQGEWQDFNLRFQWRAFGLSEMALHELKTMWKASNGYIDPDSEEYESWRSEAVRRAQSVGALPT